jgi:hypothetical protein
MKAEGFEPAVVVETSPNNFQAWLNHGQVLEAATSTCAAKALVERFGGDPSSADWRHFGRLAGFTNLKREPQLPSGLRPFTRLRSGTGRVYSRAVEFLAGITASSDGQAGQTEQPHKRPHRSKEHAGVKPLREFHSDPIYAGDLHRADTAWAKHAAGCGLKGKGLSLTMRDARVLTDLLQSNDDWDAACHEYARQHDAYFHVLHALDNSMRELLVDPGLQTDERRQRALALIAQDPTRLPDAIAGPDTPFDEAVRRRMFGED